MGGCPASARTPGGKASRPPHGVSATDMKTSRWQINSNGVLQRRPELILSSVACEPSVAIQIASDLHLEFFDHPEDPMQAAEMAQMIIPRAPILALLGDIGIPTDTNYRNFLLRQAELFEAVLVITGNHEYYDDEVPDTNMKCRRSVFDMERIIEGVCAEHPKLHFVDNTCVRLGNSLDAPALLCTPLWSYIPDHAMRQVEQSMTDYHICYVSPSTTLASSMIVARDGLGDPLHLLHPAITSHWHQAAVGWIRSEVARLKTSGCVRIGMLSHHTPSMTGTSHPKYEVPGNAASHAFSSELLELHNDEVVRLWAYGHTHYNNDRHVSGTHLVSNQRGYRGTDEGRGYKPDFAVSF